MWTLNEFSEKIVAIDESGEKKTYSQLEQFSLEIEKLLPERCFVFSFCENSIGSLFGYVAFVNNHSVPLLLSRELDIELANELIERYRPTHYWIPNELKASFHNENTKVVFERFGYLLISSGYEAPVLNNELALLLPTSGSTGSPKLVKLTYKNIKSNAQSIVEYLELSSSERPITSLPMNYSYGLSVINSHLMVGATILLTTKSLLQREFWDFFTLENATSLAGVPYNYQMLKRLKFFKMSLPSLRYLTQAGGKLSSQLQKEFAEYAQEKSLKFFVMYGQTEATARMAYLPWQNSLNKCGSIGIAIPGGKFYLIDSDGNTLEEINTTGELVYEGDNVSLGYSETREDLCFNNVFKGKLKTGDMAQIDENGFYKIVGRKKRFIKLFGNRINLDDVEQILHNQFNAIDCACNGVDDNLIIFINSFDSELKKEIKGFISQKIGIHHSAFKVESIENIPKNESGKIQYNQMSV